MNWFKKREMIIWQRLLLVVMMTTIFVLCTAQFGGGQGSEEDPYIIRTHEHLNNIKLTDDEDNFRYLSYHYIQTANIVFTPEMFAEGGAYYNDGEGWKPIGINLANSFSGSFDGNGFYISNLTIDREGANTQGLFGYVNEATLLNIKLIDVNIRAITRFYVGSLAGVVDRTTVTSCSSTGSITGNNVAEGNTIGGLIGWAINSVISECYSHARVIGWTRTGGLVGWANASDVINSYATGPVTSGGVAGGLVGLLQTWGTGAGTSTVVNSYAKGQVTVTQNQAGGLIGTISGNHPVSNSYSTGRVVGTGGGLIGQGGTVTNCYWDTNTSGKPTSAGGAGAVGRTTEHMTYPYNFEIVYTNWDFEEIWMADERFIPDEEPGLNNGYPYFIYQHAEPPIVLDIPDVKIIKQEIDGEQFVRIYWEAIENAASYIIYASFNPYDEDFGDPITIIADTHYSERLDTDNKKFYYVRASVSEPPED